MSRQARRSKSQLFNRRRRESRLFTPHPSGLNLELFDTLTSKRDTDHAPRASQERHADEREDEIDNELRAQSVTVTLTPEILNAAGINDPQTLTARDARSYYGAILDAVLANHPELTDTAVAHYAPDTERPKQGAMSMTYFLRRTPVGPLDGDDGTLYTIDGDDGSGVVVDVAEPDTVLRCQWIQRRDDKNRLLIIRDIAAMQTQGKLHAARMIKFSGLPALRDMELMLQITTRAHGEPLSNILPRQFERPERKRPELSINDMYAFMQALRAWVLRLHAMNERGIQHRDIKPDHLFINFDDPANSDIIDWGLTKSTKSSRRRTPTNDTLGTAAYFSSSAAQGRPDPNRDIFSLGISVGQALRLFFYKHHETFDESLAAAAMGTMYDVPHLTPEHFHEELRDWSPYYPERRLAYILSVMTRQEWMQGWLKGNYTALLAMIDSVLVDQRLWVEASAAMSDITERTKHTGVSEQERTSLITLYDRLKHELTHGSPDTMRPMLAEYRRLITQLQQHK